MQQGAERGVLQETVRKLEAQLAELRQNPGSTSEVDGLRGQLVRLANELSAAKVREQELGKLLGGGRPKAAPRRTAPDAEEITLDEGTVDEVPKRPPPPPDLDVGELIIDSEVDVGWLETERKPEPKTEPAMPRAVVAPAGVASPAAVAAPPASDDLDSFLRGLSDGSTDVGSFDEDLFGDLEEPELQTSIVDGRIGFDQFSKTLTRTSRLLPTDRLQSRKPASVDEALISELVKASPTFGTLLNQLGGQVREDRMRQLLYEMYARGLLDLREY